MMYSTREAIKQLDRVSHQRFLGIVYDHKLKPYRDKHKAGNLWSKQQIYFIKKSLELRVKYSKIDLIDIMLREWKIL